MTGHGLYSSGSEKESVMGSCGHGNETFSSTKGEEFLDWLSNY
jgi:hypothetical protein